MGSLYFKSHGVKYLLCVIGVFAKSTWVISLWGIKNAKTVFHSFIEIVNKCERKPNQLSVDRGKWFYNNFMQKWLDNDDILIYRTHSEGKSVVAERFIRLLKSKIYKLY